MRARGFTATLGALAFACLLALHAGSAALAAPHSGARAVLEGLARAEVAHYASPIVPAAAADCLGPAGDPAPGSADWTLRDEKNQYCATERMQDEYANPAFGATFWSETPSIYAMQNLAMAEQPGHLHLTLSQVIPGGSTTDPFRTLDRWQAAGLGRVTPISFPASDGATLNGHIFEPPANAVDRYTGRPITRPYAGIVITTGSIQGYQEMYYWAAEGLAEAGYEVMTYDVQGQGNSDTLPASSNCSGPSSCQGVPFQQSYNFYQGAEDALNYFFSTPSKPYSSPSAPGTRTYNPGYADLDTSRVGIAGHSLGASAVSEDGQCDPRVRAIVAWDNLAPSSGPCRAQIPAGLPADAPTDPSNTTPALGINSEYFLNPQPTSSPPDPQSKAGAYQQLVKGGTDSMQVALRSSMHLEYSYVPYILPGSHYGERVAFYYTLAWFDRYLRDMASGYDRLTAQHFDSSSDVHSIGGGTYDPARAAANPTDTTAGNVPTKIEGLSVPDRLSFYYDSKYSLTPPAAGTGSSASGGATPPVPVAKTTCLDMRAGCPDRAPQYP